MPGQALAPERAQVPELVLVQVQVQVQVLEQAQVPGPERAQAPALVQVQEPEQAQVPEQALGQAEEYLTRCQPRDLTIRRPGQHPEWGLRLDLGL